MKISKKLFAPILTITSTVLVILLGFLRKGPDASLVKLGVLTLLLTLAACLYIRYFESSILNKKFAKSILMLSYFSSIVLLYLVTDPEITCFWMIGGLVVSMLIDPKLGLILQFNLTFLFGIGFAGRPETVLQFLLMGVLMSMLSNYLMQKSTVIYAAIILLSTNITLAFIMNNFVFNFQAGYNYISSFFSVLLILTASFLFCRLYQRFGLKHIMTLSKESVSGGNDIYEQQEAVQTTEQAETEVTEDFRTSWELLVNPNNELLTQLRNYSEDLYEHAIMIGDISGRAARAIQADELLAKAGGLYHEIGKVRGGSYIEDGIIIAEQYNFPDKLKSILRQHNIKYEKPTSVEAAIVMLTDNLVSTIDYIEKTKKYKYTRNGIIENIFQMRMEKGTFDESGLSVKDYKLLREFYQKEFNHRYLDE
jgi:hypothetical protein